MTLDWSEANALVAEAQLAGVRFCVSQNYRYMAELRTLQRLIERGEHGTPHLIDLINHRYRPEPRTLDYPFAMVSDMGCHHFDNLVCAFGLVVGGLSIWRLEESRSAETLAQARSENPFAAYLALLLQPRLVGYALAGALNGATLFTYISGSPDLLMGTYGVSPTQFPWIFGLNAAAIIGSSQVNRYLLRHWTPDEVLGRASLASVAAAAVLSLAAVSGLGGAWTVLPLLFILLGTYGFMQGNTMAGALNVDVRRAGSVSSRSTNCHGITRGGILSSSTRSVNEGTTPFASRRMAPRAPTSTATTVSVRWLLRGTESSSTSLTRTTFRP